MGNAFRRRWPAPSRIVLTDFPAIRAPGRPLFPAAEPCCDDLAPLPKELESLGAVIQRAVERGLQRGFKEAPPISTMRAPHESPPFRSTPINEMRALIVGSSPTIGAVTSINDALINNVSQGDGTFLPIDIAFTGFTAAQLTEFFFLQAADYERIHISGVDFAVSSLDALLTLAFSIFVDGVAVVDRVRLPALRELSIDVAPKSIVRFMVQNADDLSAFLVYFTPKGWRYPCEGQGNYLSAAVLKQDGEWQIPNEACVPARRIADEQGGCG